jgi:hypothetical protein
MTAARRQYRAANRPEIMTAYASEFSACRCGSNMRYNRARQDKLIDPGLLLLRRPNAWSRLKPDP